MPQWILLLLVLPVALVAAIFGLSSSSQDPIQVGRFLVGLGIVAACINFVLDQRSMRD